VKEFDWQNPHPLLLLDVKSDKGAVETWAVEFHPPNVMARGVGWTHNTFKPGSRSPFMGIRRRKDSHHKRDEESEAVKVTFPVARLLQ